MLRGYKIRTIDSKGRLIIPAGFRDEIKDEGSNGLMISSTGMEKCLVAYSYTEWNLVENRILSLAEKDDFMRRFRRKFIGGAFKRSYDKQSRILIPPPLREYAELEKDIVIVGVLNHFEIWSLGNWENEDVLMAEDLKKEEVKKSIAKLGL